MNEVYYQALRIKNLHVVLWIKDFVENEDRCNYEIYLRELLNNSQYFQTLSQNELYTQPVDESKGQNDAISKYYEIDFKLLESPSYVESKRQTSFGLYRFGDCGVFETASNIQGEAICSKFYIVLRQIKSTNEIQEIASEKTRNIRLSKRTKDNIDEQIIHEIKGIYKILTKNKNLFLFFPYRFSFEGISLGFDEGIEVIAEELMRDFKIALQLRCSEELKNRDTYVCCLYEKYFIVFLFNGKDLIHVDSIKEDLLPTYIYLRNTYVSTF